jgi:hypothetical protein
MLELQGPMQIRTVNKNTHLNKRTFPKEHRATTSDPNNHQPCKKFSCQA